MMAREPTFQYSLLFRFVSNVMYVSMSFSSSDSSFSLSPSSTPSGSTMSNSSSSSSSSVEFLVGSMIPSMAANQSMGRALPPFIRIAAFFFACCKTNRSSSATQASSCVSAARLLGIEDRGCCRSRPCSARRGGLEERISVAKSTKSVVKDG